MQRMIVPEIKVGSRRIVQMDDVYDDYRANYIGIEVQAVVETFMRACYDNKATDIKSLTLSYGPCSDELWPEGYTQVQITGIVEMPKVPDTDA